MILIEHSIQKQQNTLSSQVLMEHSPNHILGHKSSLSKFKKIEIISNIFSDHNAMRLEMNYREKNVKKTNTWRRNNTLLNNQEITEKIRGNQKIPRDKWQWNHDDPKPMGCRASLVAQWLGVCLPMQGTWVRALVWEDPTCRGTTRPVSHNYWACASGACARQREAAIARGPHTTMKSGPRLPQLEKALAQKRRPNTAIHTYIHT